MLLDIQYSHFRNGSFVDETSETLDIEFDSENFDTIDSMVKYIYESMSDENNSYFVSKITQL